MSSTNVATSRKAILASNPRAFRVIPENNWVPPLGPNHECVESGETTAGLGGLSSDPHRSLWPLSSAFTTFLDRGIKLSKTPAKISGLDKHTDLLDSFMDLNRV